MWLFSTDGFTSVVAYSPAKDHAKSAHYEIANESADPNVWLLVRARIRADLAQIQRSLGTDLHIRKDAGADYAYRALVTRDDWKRYLCSEVDSMDYDSHFKEVVQDRAPENAQRYTAMMKVWRAMSELQDTPPYGRDQL